LKEIEFQVPRGCDLSDAEEKIEKICAEQGLVVTLKKPLAKFPGYIHWHYKRNSERGTLELTLWREKHRVWAKVQDGRRAEWIEKNLPDLRKAIERGLSMRKS
jgi:hypothetical protein